MQAGLKHGVIDILDDNRHQQQQQPMASTTSTMHRVDNGDSVDDDDDGGVPVTYRHVDPDMLNAHGSPCPTTLQPGSGRSSDEASDDDDDDGDADNAVATLVASRWPSAHDISGHDRVSSEHDPARTVVHRDGPPAASTVDHPRPGSPSIWAEEESRRRRIALDGDNTSAEPQLSHRLAIADSVEAGPTLLRTHSREDPSASQMSGPGDAGTHRSDDDSFRSRLAEQANEAHVAFHGAIVIEDDWMEVDDPRRKYDFLDFMDTWRVRAMSDERIPSFDPDLQPPTKLCDPPDHVRRQDIASGELDMQGIRWPHNGQHRIDALSARALLHPAQLRTVATRTSPWGGLEDRGGFDDENAYRFSAFTPKHRAQFCHYQLRNVLAASSRSDILYASRGRVSKASLACPSEELPIVDTSQLHGSEANLRITCLAASPHSGFPSANLLFVGGFCGEYLMLNLHAEVDSAPVQGFVTHAYNGLVTHIEPSLGRRSGLPQAAFCSNDHQIRLLDAGTARFTSSFVYEDAVNCSALSVDGRLRALVGDFSDALITDAERGDVLATLPGHTDHGFACAWAGNGLHVATGAQDGQSLVWDVRNWSRPLVALPSTMTCPRSLHFTADHALVAAENDDIVSIYRPGSFAKCQDVRFFGSIAGVALLDGGDEIVIANADQTVGGLLTFDRATREFHHDGDGGPLDRRDGVGRRRNWRRRSDLVLGVVV